MEDIFSLNNSIMISIKDNSKYGIIITILLIIAQWKIFEKAGEKGWKSLIPIYNLVILYKILGINPWLMLLYLVPIVNLIVILVLSIMTASRLAKAFNKSALFAVGLFFLAPIFWMIIGFGSSEYNRSNI